MAVPYSRQTVDSPNPLARFTHRRRISEALGLAERIAPPKARVLDYGCGPGLFLRELGQRRPDLDLVGYDPFPKGSYTDIQLIDNMSSISTRSTRLITALETCEHLTDAELVNFLTEAQRVLSSDGILLISVPIIGGPGLIIKEANQMVLRRRRSHYTIRELASAAFLGRPAPRGDMKHSHKGFDFKSLHRTTAKYFIIQRGWPSPFPRLPWYANSQMFSMWRLRSEQLPSPDLS